MDEPPSNHLKLTQDLSNAQILIDEQRRVITALGQLVTEMGQTITHYERLLDQAAKVRNASESQMYETANS